jgi:uncharacterized hydrophobic protein (TIGR00271 family)
MATIKKAWLVYKSEHDYLVSHAQDCALHLDANLESITLQDFIADPAKYLTENSHVISLLESVDLGELFACIYQHGGIVGLLPVHPHSKVCRLFDIPQTLEDAMPLALAQKQAENIDLLFCNDEVIIWMVTVGDVPFIELQKIAYEEGLFWQHIKAIPASFKGMFRLHSREISLTTAKNTKIKTAIVGAVIIENDIESMVNHFAKEAASNMDGKLSAVLVAPTSTMDYFSFIITALTPRSKLSKAIGFIKTAGLTMESTVEVDYFIDGQHRSSKHLTFKVIPKAVSVNVGKAFKSANKPVDNEKDIIKVETLPQHEDKLKPLKQFLPLFSIADEEDFKDVFLALREYAQLSVSYSLFMILSTLLATLGLFLNSAPVVIGAMLLAPLMGPLVTFAMAMLRNNLKLLKGSLFVFGMGILLALSVAAATTFLLPYDQATPEIRARLQPNLLDLAIAIVSGVAAAYAHARETVLKNLPGVAIAVALVPPACVIGIGIGWFDWNVISGAGLLLLTNLVGITFAAMLTFLCLGFAPVIKVNRGFGIYLLLAVLISVPLYKTFDNTVLYQRLEKTISAQSFQVNGKAIELSDVSLLQEGNDIKVTAQIHSSEMISIQDINALRDTLSKQLEKPVKLDVGVRISL